MTINLAVANELRAELARRRRTQAELSDAIYMTQPQVSRRLNGTTDISVDELVSMSRFLGVDPRVILDRAEAAGRMPDEVPEVTR